MIPRTPKRATSRCNVVPFFSGKFNDPDYDMQNDPTAHAGITCTVCHAISAINSPRGNSDYTIDTPIHYPFAFSENPALRWINEQYHALGEEDRARLDAVLAGTGCDALIL